ncbi:hypothetical protein CH063_00373, partial [Colletotrichum higginsianum]
SIILQIRLASAMPLALQNNRREQAYLRLPKQCPCSMRLTARPLFFDASATLSLWVPRRKYLRT